MKPFAYLAVVTSTLALFTVTACDKNDDSASGTEAEAPSQDSGADAAAKKKATVDALLRENGIDPATVTSKGASSQPGTPLAQADQGKKVALPDKATITVTSPGAEPRKVLSYKFVKGRTRKFSMDMTITPKRSINGQPMPTMPGISIGMRGTSQTIEVGDGTATRLNTFLEFTPVTEGLPPEMVQQMMAQFAGLKGSKLTEVVSVGGQVLDLQIPPESANNPQIIALLQNLQDGMTNAFLPLPKEAVGPGAKWTATSHVEAGGIKVTQVNEVHLKKVDGDKVTAELTFKQSAPPQRVIAPELPPGAEVELTGMTGGGQGSMTVDLASLVTDSKVDLSMTVDTKLSGAGAPEPVLSSTDTGMKIHLKVTE